MSREGPIPPDFAEWVIRSLDGTITPEQFAQLDHEIATNDTARAYYLELITTHVGLVDLVGGLPRAETLMGAECGTAEAAGDLRLEPQTPSEERIHEIERFASQQLAEFLAQQQREGLETKSATGWDLWAAIEGAAHTAQHAAATGARLVKAAVICLLVLVALAIIGLYIYANRTLGVLVGSADAKWDVPVEQTGQLRAGRRTLEEGYARIRLKKGAEIIVQAPSTFDLRTTNRMFLESGWITATVPPAATGFVVRTPASSVVDFGTEFGLLAGDAGNTEVHVFDGRIEFEHCRRHRGRRGTREAGQGPGHDGRCRRAGDPRPFAGQAPPVLTHPAGGGGLRHSRQTAGPGGHGRSGQRSGYRRLGPGPRRLYRSDRLPSNGPEEERQWVCGGAVAALH